MAIGEILGFHHVKVPVSDLAVSCAWYERVFDLEPNVEFRDNDDVVRGVAYQPKNDFVLSLRQNSKLAEAMKGFDPLAVLVEGRADIDAWVERLDELRVDHSPASEGALGWLIVFHDPDGIQLKLYTQDVHGLERPGRRRPSAIALHQAGLRRERRTRDYAPISSATSSSTFGVRGRR